MSKGKRNRAKKIVPAKLSPKRKKTVSTVENKLVTEQFQGPIPPPQVLSGYEQLLPGSADRILSMAEKETEHRQKMETKALDAEIEGSKSEAKDTKRGQICGLIIGITALVSGSYTAISGFPWAGSFIGAGGVAGLVSAFIAGRKGQPSNGDPSSKEIIPSQKK